MHISVALAYIPIQIHNAHQQTVTVVIISLLTATSSPFKQLSDRSSTSSTSNTSHLSWMISISRCTPLEVIKVWHRLSFVGLECMHWMTGSKHIKPTHTRQQDAV